MNELAKLKDIHLPGNVSYWPLAPGWYIALIVTLSITVLSAYWFQRRYRYNYPKRTALKLLHKLKDYPNHHAKIIQIALILKRVAIKYHGRDKVASLSGDAWIQFLNNNADKEPLFEKQQAFLLTHLIYERKPEITATQADNLLNKSIRWVKRQ